MLNKKHHDVSALLLASNMPQQIETNNAHLPEHHEKHVIRHYYDMLVEARFENVIVVIEPDSESIVTALPAIASIVVSERKGKGQTIGVPCGMDAVPGKTRGVCLVPAATPFMNALFLQRLKAAFVATNYTASVATSAKGIWHYPAIFPRALFTMLCGLRDDQNPLEMLVDTTNPTLSIDFANDDNADF